MEDKVFLDEAGLGEVGKVISKHYVNKDEWNKNKTIKRKILQETTGNNNMLSTSQLDTLFLSGYYWIDLNDFVYTLNNTNLDRNNSADALYSLWEKGQFPQLGYGVLLVEKDNVEYSPTTCIQRIFDISTGISFVRSTMVAKKEYSDNWMIENSSGQEWNDLIFLTTGDDWTSWQISCQILSSCLPVASGALDDGDKPGLMTPDDKKKLDSIDTEKYEQQEKDIKSMKEEIALLKSQIEKLQASINNKE